MLCRDCQESIASARCQDSITVILFQADISTHPLFLYRITLFECQLVTRDVQYWTAGEQYDWSLRLRKDETVETFLLYILEKNNTVETFFHLLMFKKKAI